MRLEDLERELRAERPEVEPEFARKLDEWAAAGFPRSSVDPRSEEARRRGGLIAQLDRAWERLRAVPPRRLLAPVGAAAILIAVAGAAVSQVDLGGSESVAPTAGVVEEQDGGAAGDSAGPDGQERGSAAG